MWKNSYIFSLYIGRRGVQSGLGGENTNFFHAMAIERHRRNSIASFKDMDGSVVSQHSQMEGIIWNCFKNRMGVSARIVMGFDLSALLQQIDGLDFFI